MTDTQPDTDQPEPVQANGVVHFAGPDDLAGFTGWAYETVEVPEWRNGPDDPTPVFRIKGLSGADRDSWEGQTFQLDPRTGRQKMNMNHYRARLVARCIVDGNGKRSFYTDDHVRMLSGMPASGLIRLFDVAQRLSGVTDEDVDEMTKDLGGDETDLSRNGAAGSGSRSPSAAAR